MSSKISLSIRGWMALIIGCSLFQSSVNAGVPEILDELELKWERQSFGASQLPIYAVHPSTETPNRNHWDDMVVPSQTLPDSPGWKGIVNHYTVLGLTDTLRTFTANVSDGRVSSHFVVTQREVEGDIKAGEIIQLVPESKRAWHAGVSGWRGINGGGLAGINASFLGIEHVNAGFIQASGRRVYSPYDADQILASIALQEEVVRKYDIAPSYVVGHDDITERKQDPGPLFPWEVFFKKGVGAYLSPEELSQSMVPYWSVKEPLPQGESVEFQLSYMARYGYDLDPRALLTPKNIALIEAFRGHFSCNMRPKAIPLSQHSGTRQDMAWISGLVAKYPRE